MTRDAFLLQTLFHEKGVFFRNGNGSSVFVGIVAHLKMLPPRMREFEEKFRINI